MIRRNTCHAAALAAALLAAAPAGAKGAADFFKGKRLTYVVATSPGGGYDAYARLIAKYMTRRLGVSKIIVKNMPGAGHIIGTNHVYTARPDGLTIGTFNTGLIYAQIIGRKGIRFDLSNMSWIGKAAADPRVFMVSKKSGIANFTELRKLKKPITVATSGVGSAAHNETIMLAAALGLKLKIIPGYRGKQAEMAMMRGEIVGQLGSKSSFAPFVKNGYGRFIFQVGGSGAVPQAVKLAITEDGRALARLVASQSTLGRLTAGPPGIAAARLTFLIEAYKGALGDAALRKEARKLGRPIIPLYGKDVQRRVVAALRQSPEMVRRITSVMKIKAPTATVTSALIKVGRKGRRITFLGNKGEQVKARVSGSRTKITIAGKSSKRSRLAAGMTCRITYDLAGRNEAKLIACK